MGKLLFGAASLVIAASLFGQQLAEKTAAAGSEKTARPEASRLAAAQPGNVPPSLGPRVVALKGDARGHFSTDIQVNGAFVRVLVDTGASIVALSAEDAAKAGISPPKSEYRMPMQTANGVVHAAKVRISEIRLQSLVARDVEAAVLPPGALRGTLLGMSFLKRLASFEMTGGTLVMKQ